MKILIKNATIYDELSQYHLQQMDLLIDQGIIKNIAGTIEEDANHTIASTQLSVSPGWLDIGAFNGEPGYEQREDLCSLKKAAVKGGYAFLAPLPITSPAVDNKSQINFLQRQNDFDTCEILPLAAATIGAKGDNMSEIIDLVQAGAIALTDGPQHHLSKGQTLRIIQYANGIGTFYLHYLPTNSLAIDGQINEGEMSILLGMEGLPDTEERMGIQEILEISQYANTTARIMNISTSGAIKLLQKSRVPSLVSVPYLNLTTTEKALETFDTNLKVLPPLRRRSDQRALIKAINKGIINCITSNHMPVKVEDKDKEFGLSEFGATGLETCFSALLTYVPDLDLDRLIYCLSHGAYQMIGLPAPSIAVGQKCVITLFDPSADYHVTPADTASKSMNNPFMNELLRGKIIAVVNGTKTTFVS